jgi:hypothetical protein
MEVSFIILCFLFAAHSAFISIRTRTDNREAIQDAYALGKRQAEDALKGMEEMRLLLLRTQQAVAAMLEQQRLSLLAAAGKIKVPTTAGTPPIVEDGRAQQPRVNGIIPSMNGHR